MSRVDGCKPFLFNAGGKKYSRIKVGAEGDLYANENIDSRCTNCGAKHGYFHHIDCNCERCPICGGKLLTCVCVLFDTPK